MDREGGREGERKRGREGEMEIGWGRENGLERQTKKIDDGE